MYTLMTNNQRLLTEYQELNLLAAFLFVAMLAIIVWYIQWSNEQSK